MRVQQGGWGRGAGCSHTRPSGAASGYLSASGLPPNREPRQGPSRPGPPGTSADVATALDGPLWLVWVLYGHALAVFRTRGGRSEGKMQDQPGRASKSAPVVPAMAHPELDPQYADAEPLQPAAGAAGEWTTAQAPEQRPWAAEGRGEETVTVLQEKELSLTGSFFLTAQGLKCVSLFPETLQDVHTYLLPT